MLMGTILKMCFAVLIKCKGKVKDRVFIYDQR
jgi:hypothetical protein